MTRRTSRRKFLGTTAATGIGFWVAGGVRAQESKSPNEKIRMASIGIGGKGSSDSRDAGNAGEMVAICDVDETRLDAAGKKWPEAKKFSNFREMLEKMHDKIDAVTVSTTDHVHAVAAAMVMRMGKHCFCQKPLTHSIYEARTLGQIAREMKVATQMGNQGTAGDGLRKAVATVHAGAIGAVKEVHVWTNRPIWPQGGERPPEEPVPANLKWDLWIGPAPMRPYGKGYHPFAWRGWWDFGTGALGDMACHTMNMPFRAAELHDPISVVAETSGHNKDSYPKWSIITYEFAATAKRPAVKLFWYDGGKRPSEEVLSGQKAERSGVCILGEKGKLYAPGDNVGKFELLGGPTQPEVEIVKSPGHFEEWVQAIRGGKPAMSNFPEWAVPLTEIVLLGNLAVWAADKGQGKKIEWDAKNLKPTNAPEVAHIVHPEFRKGYTL